jgi:hypothetical protein
MAQGKLCHTLLLAIWHCGGCLKVGAGEPTLIPMPPPCTSRIDLSPRSPAYLGVVPHLYCAAHTHTLARYSLEYGGQGRRRRAVGNHRCRGCSNLCRRPDLDGHALGPPRAHLHVSWRGRPLSVRPNLQELVWTPCPLAPPPTPPRNPRAVVSSRSRRSH